MGIRMTEVFLSDSFFFYKFKNYFIILVIGFGIQFEPYN